MFDSLFDTPLPPEHVLRVGDERRISGVIFCVRQKSFRRVRTPIPQDVLAKLQQLARNVVVQGQVACVDDS